MRRRYFFRSGKPVGSRSGEVSSSAALVEAAECHRNKTIARSSLLIDAQEFPSTLWLVQKPDRKAIGASSTNKGRSDYGK